jgi:hypothetical protein
LKIEVFRGTVPCLRSVRLGSLPEEQWRNLNEENGRSATNFKSADLNEIQMAAETGLPLAGDPAVASYDPPPTDVRDANVLYDAGKRAVAIPQSGRIIIAVLLFRPNESRLRGSKGTRMFP